MHKKQANEDVILADMHADGTKFTKELAARKKAKEFQKERVERLKSKK
ncbi:hypothetical protein [Aquimarina brevivitae]|uniref:Uncharacterized protein n=1 Tax=Aquimarina brevivitae TaxID=323412 RepID=A0A4Q7P1G2_9FLAO|nr:hypothetical protein [Aquimarina brevivitae]RZS93671.1 hypothetical protein EV197_2251 [Aquimarina brevivitae]